MRSQLIARGSGALLDPADVQGGGSEVVLLPASALFAVPRYNAATCSVTRAVRLNRAEGLVGTTLGTTLWEVADPGRLALSAQA